MSTVEETFVPRASSNIESVTYEPDVNNLTVVFSGGRTYLYFNVPVSVYRQITASTSVGSFIKRNVVGRYAYEEQ